MARKKAQAKKYLYFCYGSNLNLNQMDHRCPKAMPIGIAYLANYVLEFRGRSDSAVASVRRAGGSLVVGGLWLITEECLVSLDRYEGYPNFYRREIVEVEFGGKIYEAITYIINSGYSVNLPSRYYYNAIADGFKDFGIDKASLVDAVCAAQEEVMWRKDLSRFEGISVRKASAKKSKAIL